MLNPTITADGNGEKVEGVKEEEKKEEEEEPQRVHLPPAEGEDQGPLGDQKDGGHEDPTLEGERKEKAEFSTCFRFKGEVQ